MLTVEGVMRPPVVLELIGPAGAGKSSLARVLAQRDGSVHATIWDIPHARLLVDGFRALPTLATLSMGARALPWQEFKHVVRVRGLQQRVHRMARSGGLVVLDEGPVFTATWLLVSGHRSIPAGPLHGWWKRSLLEWCADLDVIVVLDAADDLLAERIRLRAKPHQVKQKSDGEIFEFLGRFRSAFDRVVTELVAERGIRVVRLQAACESQRLAHDLVHSVMATAHAN